MTALLLLVGLPLALAPALLLPGRAGAAAHAAAPVAALPALALAVAPVGVVDVGWLMLGARLGVDEVARVLVVLAALVWTAAGLALRRTLRRAGAPATRTLALALVAMSGTLGTAVALDAVTFYACFSAMTLAAYGIVVVVPTAFARRAGRIYVAMAVLGEAALLGGLVTAVDLAGSTDLGAIRAALGDEAGAGVPLALLVGGFGVKAGALGLHLWLPLAYAAAPRAGAAALAGVVTEVGLLGWLRTLPLGAADRPGWAALLVAVGLAGAAYGVAVGLTQRTPALVLAYSSVSQIGIMTAGVGAALADARLAGAATASVLLYLLHHGLVKGALFLGLGAMAGSATAAGRRTGLALLGAAALALAGAPATSGGLAKDALKYATSAWQGWMEWSLPVAAVGTVLLMGRLMILAAREERPDDSGRAAWPGAVALLAASIALVPLASRVAPFDDVAAPLPSPGGALAALWPIVLGVLLLWAARRHRGRVGRVPEVPAGDVAVGAEWFGGRAALAWRRVAEGMGRARRRAESLARRPDLAPAGRAMGVAEARLTAWAVAAILAVVVVVGLAVTL